MSDQRNFFLKLALRCTSHNRITSVMLTHAQSAQRTMSNMG